MKLGERLSRAVVRLRVRGCHVTHIELCDQELEQLESEHEIRLDRRKRSPDGAVCTFRGIPVYPSDMPSGVPVIAYEAS